MEVKAMVESSVTEQIVGLEQSATTEALKGAEDRERIVERPERIDRDLKETVSHEFTYIVAETGADQQNGSAVTNCSLGKPGRNDRRAKFHECRAIDTVREREQWVLLHRGE